MLAAGLGAEMPAQAEELLLQQMPPGFIDWPMAAQSAWSYLSAAEWNEKAPAIINAFNKAKEAGALQSTAERADAAIAMHTFDGFREWNVDQKRRILERRVATKKMKAFACEARVLLKKARRLVDKPLPWNWIAAIEFTEDVLGAVERLDSGIHNLVRKANSLPRQSTLGLKEWSELYRCRGDAKRAWFKAGKAHREAMKVGQLYFNWMEAL